MAVTAVRWYGLHAPAVSSDALSIALSNMRHAHSMHGATGFAFFPIYVVIDAGTRFAMTDRSRIPGISDIAAQAQQLADKFKSGGKWGNPPEGACLCALCQFMQRSFNGRASRVLRRHTASKLPLYVSDAATSSIRAGVHSTVHALPNKTMKQAGKKIQKAIEHMAARVLQVRGGRRNADLGPGVHQWAVVSCGLVGWQGRPANVASAQLQPPSPH